MLLPGRHGQEPSTGTNGYRYSFQGQEHDDEVKGKGNSINYKYRMHDPRIGRFFAVDPLADKYPHYTPYQFSGNKVIAWTELEGLEEEGTSSTKSTTDQMKKYQNYEKSKYDNPFKLPLAQPMGEPLEDYVPLDKSRTIDQDRNPTKYWIPGCLSNGGTPCTFYQYGQWRTETTSTDSDPVSTTVNAVNVRMTNFRLIGTINNPFVPRTNTPTTAFTGTLLGALGVAAATPLPPMTMGFLPAAGSSPTTVILSDNTVPLENLIGTERTVVSQTTTTRVTNSTVPLANVISIGIGTNVGPARTASGMPMPAMLDLRGNNVLGAMGNPANLQYNSGLNQFNITGATNRAYIYSGVRTRFTTSITTTIVTTTTVTRNWFDFMRTRDNSKNYIPVINR